MSRRTHIALILALTLFAVVRVASTHRVFNAVVDEPVHLAAGWIWLGGEYNIDLGHPPLARVLCALPLRLAGVPEPPAGNDNERGTFLLYHGDRYLKNLARARAGNLPLFVAAILAVAALAQRAFGRGVSVMATALFTSLPPVLAHAALITTDMAVTAALPLALLALDRFLEAPTARRGIALGAAIGMGVLAKFSFFVYFPAAALILLAVRRRVLVRPAVRTLLVVVLVVFAVTWAGYRFAFGTMADVFHGASFFTERAAPEPLKPAARWFSEHVPIPAPALAVGLVMLKNHDDDGHFAFLLGETGTKGWWSYFPVVFFYKTPLAFLALCIAGIAFAVRRRAGIEHALIPLAVLLAAMTGSINIGVRHVLPMYASLAVIAAHGAAALWRAAARTPWGKLGYTALLAWLFAGVAAAHPDYLAYFNEAAGAHPERIAVDSNLDWGQDVTRLERVLRELKVGKVHILYSTGAKLDRHIPAETLGQQTTGWIAIGETPLAMFADRYQWLTRYEPVRKVGRSMRLYYIPQ